MGLARYRRKRNFTATPEPSGRKRSSARAPKRAFVIQKHAARRLHYDLRLEFNGALLSWAVPKGPSLDPADKRLAVRVEDHPLDYGSFEGRIPEGEYGAGEVIVWDRGTWTPEGTARAALEKGRLNFVLQGKKLHGAWTLVRLRNNAEKNENWLLMKRRDEYARTGSPAEITARMPRSVISRKTIGPRRAAGKELQ